MRSTDKEKFSMAFGETLYKHRSHANMANMTYTDEAGIGENTLINWEKGRCLPRLEVLIAAAKPFGLKGWELYKEVEEMYARKKARASNGVRVDKADKGRGNDRGRNRR